MFKPLKFSTSASNSFDPRIHHLPAIWVSRVANALVPSSLAPSFGSLLQYVPLRGQLVIIGGDFCCRKQSIRKKGWLILNKVNAHIERLAHGDEGMAFYLNRFVFQRLKLREDRLQKLIKSQLLKINPSCCFCPKAFSVAETKGVGIDLHHVNPTKHRLAHRRCHQKHHRSDRKIRGTS